MVSLRFTLFLSLSLYAISLTLAAQATPSDVLSQLGPKQLDSCFKFLVPYNPFNSTIYDQDNLQIWWPPMAVLELARLAFDFGGCPDAIHQALDRKLLHVPEGQRRKLSHRTPNAEPRRFKNEELNSYLEFLFKLIVDRGPSIGLNVSLSDYDLFHGHLFIDPDTTRLGILFHAKEYPAYDEEVFPYNIGAFHIGSNVTYDESMNLRNILWLAPLPSNSPKAWIAPGVLVVLDAHPEGIIYRDLIPDNESMKFFRTIYEGFLGTPVVDINYLNVGGVEPDYQIFIC